MDNRTDILDKALKAWRESSKEETLSGPARSALFSEVRTLGESPEGVFVPSVARAWRWAFLGSVPVVALATVLMVAGDHHSVTGSRLAATKVDGQVVFTVANGKADHLLYRSTDPQSFGRTPAVKMARNRYIENATGGPALVFYRID